MARTNAAMSKMTADASIKERLELRRTTVMAWFKANTDVARRLAAVTTTVVVLATGCGSSPESDASVDANKPEIAAVDSEPEEYDVDETTDPADYFEENWDHDVAIGAEVIAVEQGTGGKKKVTVRAQLSYTNPEVRPGQSVAGADLIIETGEGVQMIGGEFCSGGEYLGGHPEIRGVMDWCELGQLIGPSSIGDNTPRPTDVTFEVDADADNPKVILTAVSDVEDLGIDPDPANNVVVLDLFSS